MKVNWIMKQEAKFSIFKLKGTLSLLIDLLCFCFFWFFKLCPFQPSIQEKPKFAMDISNSGLSWSLVLSHNTNTC